MKNLIQPILISALFLSSLQIAQAQTQETKFGSRFSLQANIGITSYDLTDVKSFYKDMVSIYTEQGVPVPTQKKYNPNMLFGLAGIYRIPKIIDVGLGTQYSCATALSSYADYAGTLKVKSNVWFNTVEVIIQKEFRLTSHYQFFTSLRGGTAIVHAEYTHDIYYYGMPNQSGYVKLTGSKTGYTAEGLIGVKRNFANIEAFLTAGYRSMNVKKLDAKLEATGMMTETNTLELKHDLSGLVLNVMVAYRF